MPVTLEPTAVITEPGWGMFPSAIRCTSGSNTTRKPSTFARIQPGRSTTATRPSSGEPGKPVSSRTGSATSSANWRSSATTFLASAMLTCGPGLTQRTPVAVATCQSIICVVLTPPPYVDKAVSVLPGCALPAQPAAGATLLRCVAFPEERVAKGTAPPGAQAVSGHRRPDGSLGARR